MKNILKKRRRNKNQATKSSECKTFARSKTKKIKMISNLSNPIVDEEQRLDRPDDNQKETKLNFHSKFSSNSSPSDLIIKNKNAEILMLKGKIDFLESIIRNFATGEE